MDTGRSGLLLIVIFSLAFLWAGCGGGSGTVASQDPASSPVAAPGGTSPYPFDIARNGSRIAGRLQTAEGQPIQGAAVTYSGPVNGSVITDSQGRYATDPLPDGDYTVTPSHPNYVFSPGSYTISLVTFMGQQARGLSGPDRHLISGTITVIGAPLSGVTVTIDGPGSNDFTTTTDGSGFFTVTTQQNGGYLVTPSHPNYIFSYGGTPGSGQGTGTASITINNASVGGVDFTATKVKYDITGNIKDAQTGAKMTGVTVDLTGDSTASTTTDSNGNYLFQGLANGNYTVTPSQANYTFSPVNRAVTISGADVSAQDFQGTYQLLKISGKITSVAPPPKGVGGITVNYTGPTNGSVTTDGNGVYEILNVSNGAYSITPSHSDYTFSYTGVPGTGQGTGTAAITVAGATIIDANFDATKIRFTISGTVTNGGTPLNNITVNLTGDATRSTTTNASGYYEFTSLNNGNYTVTPTDGDYVFVPTSKAVTVSGDDKTNTNFATAIQNSIVFISTRDGNDEIYIMNPNGTGQTRLTNDPASDSDPRLSPDYTLVVFSTDRSTIFAANDNPEGDYEICIMDITGTLLLRLTDNAVDDWAPFWSGNQLLVYYTQDRGNNGDVYVMNADSGGTGKTPLAATAGLFEGYPSRANAPDLGKDVIVYQRGSEIYYMDTNGANPTAAVTDSSFDGLADSDEIEEPRISPNGEYIAFRAVNVGTKNDADLWTYRISNGALFQVTTNAAWDWRPTWSSASNTIIFTSFNRGSPANTEQVWSILSTKTDTQGGNQLTQYTSLGDNWWGGRISGRPCSAPGGRPASGVTPR